jgi:AraC family transcriptional regulator of adaptative response / DNA-3-methyladenine glycosylase II
MPSTPDTPAGLDRLFPDAAALAALDPAHSLLSPELGALGIVRQRQRALLALAHAVQAGRLQLDGSAPLADTLAALTALPGIGDWTAQYIALRALRWPDAFPAGDVVLQNRLGTRQAGRSPRRRPWPPRPPRPPGDPGAAMRCCSCGSTRARPGPWRRPCRPLAAP